MTAPHHLNAPDGSFAIGDGEQWGQNWDVNVVQLLTMGGILPDPNNIFGTIRSWLGNLPLEILELLFRPLLPLSTDADWVDTPTAVNTILSALPLQQLLQFFEWVKTVFDPFKKLFDDLLLVLSGVLVNPGGILQPVADFLGGAVQGLKDLVAGIISLFGGSGSTVADALAALSGWLGGAFKNLSDGLAGIVKTVQDLLDALFSAFGGVAGTGKTITETIAAITGWFTGVFQKLIDGITALMGLIPGLSPGSNPIQNAINVIAGILGIGNAAAAAAADANMGIAAITAEQKGGSKDEFDYSVAANLPAPWSYDYIGAAPTTWGPDGNGRVVAKFGASLPSSREVHYRMDTPLMPAADVTVSLVLSKAPHADAVVQSYFWIEAQRSATDKSCVRVKVGKTTAEFEQVNGSGVATKIGSTRTIGAANSGDTYQLVIAGTTATLIKNNITQCSETITPLAGRCIGFGASHPSFTWLSGHPAPEFNGISWHG